MIGRQDMQEVQDVEVEACSATNTERSLAALEPRPGPFANLSIRYRQTSDMPRILVLGAGELGIAIITALAAEPSSSVSVLLRPSSSTELSSLPVQVVRGDIAAPLDQLAPLLKGYDIVISATGFSSGPGSQLRLAKAAIQARVPHYIPWQFGVDYDAIGYGSSQPLFDEQLDVRALLREQTATKWTIVSTGLFTSFLFHPAFGVVDHANKTVTALGSWENKLTITSAENIGRYTAKIAISGVEGVVYVGDDTVTFAQVAEHVDQLAAPAVRRVMTVPELEQKLKAGDEGAKYQLIWARNRGVNWDLRQTWNHEHGLGAQSLSDWRPT